MLSNCQLLFNAVKALPCVNKKECFELDQLKKMERIVAFADVEGIILPENFASLFWIKKCSFMLGLTFSNYLLSRDEGLHCVSACLMISHSVHKPSQRRVTQIIMSYYEFLSDALCVS